MRRIMREGPILTGNLPPADLPNPHEPVRSEEKIDERAGGWTPLQQPVYEPFDNDGEGRQPTVPLNNEQAMVSSSQNGRGTSLGFVADTQTFDTLAATTLPTSTHQGWFSRLLRFSSTKE